MFSTDQCAQTIYYILFLLILQESIQIDYSHDKFFTKSSYCFRLVSIVHNQQGFFFFFRTNYVLGTKFWRQRKLIATTFSMSIAPPWVLFFPSFYFLSHPLLFLSILGSGQSGDYMITFQNIIFINIKIKQTI